MSTPSQTVKPELVGGTRDLLPAEALAQNTVIARVRKVYESFGFVPLETPCLERWDVLTGGAPDFNKSLFRTTIVRGSEDAGIDAEELGSSDSTLRFDLTVPLARVVSAYPTLPRPFKRYQIGRVFRGERPQAGRFREFTQFDFDIVGSRSILADVEVIQVMYAAMRALGVEDFVIRFNTRKVLNGLADLVGCTNAKELLRIIDKLDKKGFDGVAEALRRQPVNEFDDAALAFSDAQVDRVLGFLKLQGADTQTTLAGLKDLFVGTTSEAAVEGIKELTTIVEMLKALGIPQANWSVDLSVARGLDYYNGPVFETSLTDMPELGSVLSGGRFDGLMDRFVPGSNIAGVGASVGIDRMVIGLQKLGLLPSVNSVTQVLVTVFAEELRTVSLVLASELRDKGAKTEIYFGEDRTLRAQLAYATKQGIPYVVIAGPEEIEKGTVQLKDMSARKQEVLTRDACADTIMAKLNS
ncbi:MAG: histidine--tRNA ligase [bacterium]|nr:histidine--tRNA ligase [bacterium]